MKSKEQRINEIESSPKYNNWRYDRNDLRDLLDEVNRDALLFAQEQIMESTTQTGALNKIMAATPNVKS